MIERRTVLAFLLGGALLSGEIARAATGADRRVYLFNIPAQGLQSALFLYAGIVGTQIICDSKSARGVRSQPVVGLFTADTALRLMITGSPFTIVAAGPDIALVPLAEIKADRLPGNEPGENVTIVLDTLYVDVPPGARDRPDYSTYGDLVRVKVRHTLTSSPQTARRIYNARLEVWIDPRGSISGVHLKRSSGTDSTDISLLQSIERITFDRPPPEGMPQPIFITVIGI